MADRRPEDEVPVDRRQETVVTEEPGYEGSRQVRYDAASEHRQRTGQVASVIWLLFGVLEALLGLRFVLRLVGANPESGFAAFVYGLTEPFLRPFYNVFGTPQVGGSALETTTLLAMIVYALLGWLLVRLIELLFFRPSARTVSQTRREELPPEDWRRNDNLR
jgi:YggT family protein